MSNCRALNSKAKSKCSLMVACLIGSIISASSVFAAEINVQDKNGTPYLKIDAPEGSKFDLVVAFNPESKVAEVKDVNNLYLTTQSGDSREVAINAESIKKGIVLSGVSTGTYEISTSSSDIEIKRVDVANADKRAALSATEESTSFTAYAVGAAAVVGGAVAVAAGGDNLDIFNGSSNSGASTARDGVRNGGINTASITDVDPNRPTPPALSPAIGANVNPAPPVLTDPVGNNGPEAPSGGNPVVAPAPPFTPPMTPS